MTTTFKFLIRKCYENGEVGCLFLTNSKQLIFTFSRTKLQRSLQKFARHDDSYADLVDGPIILDGKLDPLDSLEESC